MYHRNLFCRGLSPFKFKPGTTFPTWPQPAGFFDNDRKKVFDSGFSYSTNVRRCNFWTDLQDPRQYINCGFWSRLRVPFMSMKSVNPE